MEALFRAARGVIQGQPPSQAYANPTQNRTTSTQPMTIKTIVTAAAMAAATAIYGGAHAMAGPQPHGCRSRDASRQVVIGNGRLGATITARPGIVTLAVTDATLAGGISKADSLPSAAGEPPATTVATLTIADCDSGNASVCEWQLSMADGICRDGYTKGGMRVEREYFASRPDSLIAIHLRASGSGTLCCTVSLSSPLAARVKASSGGQLTMTGRTAGTASEAKRFCVIARTDAPSLGVGARGNAISISGCAEATIYMVCRTSADASLPGGAGNAAPYLERAADDAWHTVNYSYSDFRARHLAACRATGCDEEKHNPAPTVGPQPARQ